MKKSREQMFDVFDILWNLGFLSDHQQAEFPTKKLKSDAKVEVNCVISD